MARANTQIFLGRISSFLQTGLKTSNQIEVSNTISGIEAVARWESCQYLS